MDCSSQGRLKEASAEIAALSKKTADADQAIAQFRKDLAVSREALALSHAAFEAASASNEDKAIALQDRQKECEELRKMKNNAEAQAAVTMAALAQAEAMLAARTEAVAKAQAEVDTTTGLLRCAESECERLVAVDVARCHFDAGIAARFTEILNSKGDIGPLIAQLQQHLSDASGAQAASQCAAASALESNHTKCVALQRQLNEIEGLLAVEAVGKADCIKKLKEVENMLVAEESSKIDAEDRASAALITIRFA